MLTVGVEKDHVFQICHKLAADQSIILRHKCQVADLIDRAYTHNNSYT